MKVEADDSGFCALADQPALGRARFQPGKRPIRQILHPANQATIRLRRSLRRMAHLGPMDKLSRVPGDVRSTEQEPNGFALMDESSGVAIDGLADVRLLL